MCKPLVLLWVFLATFPVAQVQAQSKWQLEHINILGIDSELKANAEGTLLAYTGQTFDDQLQEQIEEDLQQALQALGYYHSQTIFDANAQNNTLVINVVPGEPLQWQNILLKLSGPAEEDVWLVNMASELPIKVGDTLNHANYSQAKASVEGRLLERGYFDFKWLRHELRVNKSERNAQVVWHIDSGERYRFGVITVDDSTKAQKYIRSLATFKVGEPYNSEALSQYTLSLNNTPYFLSAKVFPQLKERANGILPIKVEAIDKPAHSFEVGGGYSTDLGAKARLKWAKPWLTEDGHFVESNLSLSERRQDIMASYTIPVSDPNNDVWRMLAGYQINDDLQQGINSKIWNVQVQRQWLTSDNWVRTLFLKREHEETEQDGDPFKSEMLLPGISYAKKQSKGGATPYWANERLISVEAASDSLISSTSLLKVRWNNAWLRNYYEKHYLISRVNLGAIVVDDIHSVPFNMRFFAGGDQSIRGFSYRSIGPKEEDKEVGGKYLVTGSVEYNYQFAPKWRAALFVDGGTATNDFSEKWSVGAGFGFRYITPVGPVRLDHAWGLSKESRSTRLSIVIGPEI